ncbi:MAG: hypothetical protein IKD72_00405 [Clostridia bacterium]|nr:hypothetical protein [Clostridia bacterium]
MKQKKAIKRLISMAMALLLFAGLFLPAAYAAEEPTEEIYVFDYVESIEYLGEKHPYLLAIMKPPMVVFFILP